MAKREQCGAMGHVHEGAGAEDVFKSRRLDFIDWSRPLRLFLFYFGQDSKPNQQSGSQLIISRYVTNIYSSLLKQCSYIKGFKTIFTRKYTRIEQGRFMEKLSLLQQKIGVPLPENGIDLREKCSNFTRKLFHIWEKIVHSSNVKCSIHTKYF